MTQAEIERIRVNRKGTWSRDCQHGHIARSCEICERDLLITSLQRLLREALDRGTVGYELRQRIEKALKP